MVICMKKAHGLFVDDQKYLSKKFNYILLFNIGWWTSFSPAIRPCALALKLMVHSISQWNLFNTDFIYSEFNTVNLSRAVLTSTERSILQTVQCSIFEKVDTLSTEFISLKDRIFRRVMLLSYELYSAPQMESKLTSKYCTSLS
jgi:hypothetical protein